MMKNYKKSIYKITATEMSVNGKRWLTCYLYVKSVYNLRIICKDSDCI